MELYNSTLYNYQAIINGVSYDLKSRSSIFFDCENNASVELKCLNKSFVHIDWISVITMHMLFGSSTITGIYANYSFVIKDAGVDKLNCLITIGRCETKLKLKRAMSTQIFMMKNILCQALKRLGKSIKRFIRLFQMRFLSA